MNKEITFISNNVKGIQNSGGDSSLKKKSIAKLIQIKEKCNLSDI